MKLFEEIIRINTILNEDVNVNYNKVIDLLIRSITGGIKKIKFINSVPDEFFWIKNYDDNINYNQMTYSEFRKEYPNDVIFYKNSWGTLWFINCEFYQLYIDNIVDSRDTDENKYDKLKYYFLDKYGIKIRRVLDEDCGW